MARKPTDPTGRADILLSRLLERIVERQNPAVRALYWTFRPAVDAEIRRLARSLPVLRIASRTVRDAARARQELQLPQQEAKPVRRASLPRRKTAPDAGAGQVIDVQCEVQ